MLERFRKQKPDDSSQSLIFDAQIGGYYTYKTEDGTWAIYRLLDFTVYATHSAMFREHFDHKPTFEEVKVLQPFMLHAPIAKAALFDESDLTLLGAQPVEAADLEGYLVYLEHMGANEGEIKEIIERVGSLQRQGRAKLKLTKIGDQVETTVIEA